mmetsp:Transcript_12344/g.21847  ORF Transcript_12344/g.21847 Transcript_12344/m.21847 type:complete len:134 (+) Transcript_12344:79-480(+)
MAQKPVQVLLEGLKDLAWKAYELEEITKNFGQDSQAVLEERMTQFIEGVRKLAPVSSAVQGVMIPIDLLQYVDDGGNPHQYTAEAFAACVHDNQVVKSKVLAVQALHDSLLHSLHSTQPEVAATYQSQAEKPE